MLLNGDELTKFNININGDFPFYNKDKDAINHLFINCAFIISPHYPSLLLLTIISLVSLNIFGFRKYHNKIFLSNGKDITTLWSIWNHRSYLIFQNKKSKPTDIINQAKNAFQDTMLYTKGTNLFRKDDR